jgi:ADP-heptose:LPS heptosyltransferase
MKLLVTRMSSLGDVLLSTAFLENLPEGVRADWIISKEFSFVLEGHPRIRRLISFDKSSGIRGWIRLIWGLRHEDYDYRIDLHRTLRSQLASILFLINDLFVSTHRKPKRLNLSKQRIRSWIHFILKGWTPKSFLPTQYWVRFGQLAQSIQTPDFHKRTQLNPPSFLPMLSSLSESEDLILERYQLQRGSYFSVMPASRWKSKEWSPQKYALVCSKLATNGRKVLLLGREKDQACQDLLNELNRLGIPTVSALNEANFKVTAVLIRHSQFFLGGDTGLAHLAEAVGTSAKVIFGPTRPSLGFGPRGASSQAISLKLSCAPCSKDGKHCFRVLDPYACLKRLDVETVLRELSS